MQPFELSQIAWPTLAIFLVTLLLSLRLLGSYPLALLLGLAKAAIFFLYFHVFFDGSYTFLDDWSYLQGGRLFIEHDIGIANLLEKWDFALSVGRGQHFLYYLYNAVAIQLFGDGYHAPVALNVITTVFIAFYGAKLFGEEFTREPQNARLFYCFLLLHPDVLAWSNTVNGKDILVLLLHVLLLHSISLYFRAQPAKSIALGIAAILLLTYLRFYVPFVFGVALLLYVLTNARKTQILRAGFWLSIAAMVYLAFNSEKIQESYATIERSLSDPLFGFVRFLLTPVPFGTETNYAFLDLPALFHWLAAPLLVLGFIGVWRRRTPYGKFFVFYAATFFALYSVYIELQGPRHRVQLDYAIAVFQFTGLAYLLGGARRARGGSLGAPAR